MAPGTMGSEFTFLHDRSARGPARVGQFRRNCWLEERSPKMLYPKVNETVIVVSTSTGSPFSKVGRYLHCFTASSAAGTNIGFPETTRRSSTTPLSADDRL